MVKRLSIFTAAVIALLCIPCKATEYDYGLGITTYPHPHNETTSVVLDNGKPFSVGNKALSLKFSMFTREENVFGTIARIITDKGDNIDLMYTVGDTQERNAMLVNGEYVTVLSAPAPVGRWVDVRMTLNPRSGEINLDFDGNVTTVKDAGTKGARTFTITFGLCPLPGFVLDDVASVDIKDIEVFVGDKTIRRWTMGVHEGDICYDEINHSPAATVNPRWILDKYITWRKLYSTDFPTEPSVAFSAADNAIYMVCNGSELDRFSLTEGRGDRITDCKGVFPASSPNQIICSDNGKLYAYSLGENAFAQFNFATRTWEGDDVSEVENVYWNNTSLWDEDTKTIFSFGGYGHHRYKNAFLLRYPDAPERSWNMTIPEITPRYAPASCLVDSLIYIFGGRGNLSSHQELSPKYYYDLYTINKYNYDVKCLWDRPVPEEGHFVPSSNMIYNADDDCFYAASYIGNEFYLTRIDRADGTMERASTSTAAEGGEQYSYITLGQTGGRMYCTVVKSSADGRSTVSIYDMNYPPIPTSVLEATTRKPAPEKEKPRGRGANYVLLSLVLLLFAGLLFVEIPRFTKNKEKGKPAEKESEDEFKATHYYDFSKSSICFFGGFHVNDKDGNNVTAQFTPTLKYLTILLILYSAKDSQGIISNKINSLLWSYKPEDAANNNRNVYVSKLRTLFENVGDIKINCQNKFWSIQFGEGASCDYLEAMRILGEESTEENIDRLLELLLRGMMLPNVELDWVDKFKGDFSNTTIDFLCCQLEREDLRSDVLLQAANTIFQHDFLNEDALKTKCRILYRQGKVGLSKKVYDNFIKEYEESIGMEYPTDYKDIISA